MNVQLGALFPTHDMPADHVAIRDWAQAAESLHYDYIQVGDRVLGADRAALPGYNNIYDVDDVWHETFVTLSYIAGVTERVALASGVLILPPRQTALVAKQAAQVDIVSGGRLRLGIGIGTNPLEYEALGQDWQTRGRRQEEQIMLMNRLWTERAVTFEGEFDRVQHAGINPLPIQRPIPIWFGGETYVILRRAAKYGQGWLPPGRPSEEMERKLASLQDYLRAEGRDPSAFGIEPWIRSNIGGPDQWRHQAERWVTLGASHVTFWTSRLGIGPVEKQIEAMEQFRDAMR